MKVEKRGVDPDIFKEAAEATDAVIEMYNLWGYAYPDITQEQMFDIVHLYLRVLRLRAERS